MSMRRILLTCSGVGVFLVLALTACHVSQTTVDSNRIQCQRNLRAIENAVKEFTYDHSGQRPGTLDDALSNIGFADVEKTAGMLRCPGISGVSAGSDIASRTGYRYIDWSRWFGSTNAVPAFYPLIYDRFLHNHHGGGVNIVSVDGTISWDEGARTLREFAEKHPEYRLPLPE